MKKILVFIVCFLLVCRWGLCAFADLTSGINSPYTKVYSQEEKKSVLTKVTEFLFGKKDENKMRKERYDAKRGIGKYNKFDHDSMTI